MDQRPSGPRDRLEGGERRLYFIGWSNHKIIHVTGCSCIMLLINTWSTLWRWKLPGSRQSFLKGGLGNRTDARWDSVGVL